MSRGDPLLNVAELALKELGKRLKTDPKAIPAHVLSRVAADTMRVLDRREKASENDTDSVPFSLLDQLDMLPKTRGDALLKARLEELRVEIDALKAVQKSRASQEQSTG